jgi:hypothetical protein
MINKRIRQLLYWMAVFCQQQGRIEYPFYNRESHNLLTVIVHDITHFILDFVSALLTVLDDVFKFDDKAILHYDILDQH